MRVCSDIKIFYWKIQVIFHFIWDTWVLFFYQLIDNKTLKCLSVTAKKNYPKSGEVEQKQMNLP